MKKAIQKAIDCFGEDIEETAVSPATKRLVKVNDTKLDEKKAEFFHCDNTTFVFNKESISRY